MARKVRIDDWLTEEKQLVLKMWATDGLSMQQIADNIGVDRTTIYNWMKKNSTFSSLLREGRDHAVSRVENALFKAACGYTYDEYVIDENEHGGSKRTIRKYARPDVRAAELWLRTKARDKYARKEQAEIKRIELQFQENGEDNSSNLMEALMHVGDRDWNKPENEEE